MVRRSERNTVVNISRIVLAAAAIALSTGAAYADARHNRDGAAPRGVHVMTVTMERDLVQKKTIFGTTPSAPSIFGHPVLQPHAIYLEQRLGDN